MNLFSRTIVMVLYAGISSFVGILQETKANAIPTTVIAEPVDYMKATKIITNHYNNKSNYSSVYIRANAKYAMTKRTQNVTAEIKIKRRANLGVSDFWGLPWQSVNNNHCKLL
jgi:hypothetical protein